VKVDQVKLIVTRLSASGFIDQAHRIDGVNNNVILEFPETKQLILVLLLCAHLAWYNSVSILAKV